MPMIIIDEGPGSAGAPLNTADGQRLADLSHFQTPMGLAKIGQIVSYK
jgi:hypothetical protein